LVAGAQAKTTKAGERSEKSPQNMLNIGPAREKASKTQIWWRSTGYMHKALSNSGAHELERSVSTARFGKKRKEGITKRRKGTTYVLGISQPPDSDKRKGKCSMAMNVHTSIDERE